MIVIDEMYESDNIIFSYLKVKVRNIYSILTCSAARMELQLESHPTPIPGSHQVTSKFGCQFN